MCCHTCHTCHTCHKEQIRKGLKRTNIYSIEEPIRHFVFFLHSAFMSSFDLSALHSVIRDSSPLCDDVIGIIADLARPDPSLFKVGETYANGSIGSVVITRITKCFVRFDVNRLGSCIDNHQMAKIRVDELGNQYIKHKYIYDKVVSKEP